MRSSAGLLLVLAVMPLRSQPPVSLNVAAIDAAGQPVAGLQTADFRVSDGGRLLRVVWSHPLGQPRQVPAIFILLDLLNADAVPGWRAANRDVILRRLCERVAQAVEQLDPRTQAYLYLLTPTAKIVAVHGVPAAGTKPVPDVLWTTHARTILDDTLRQTPGPGEQFLFPLPIARMRPTWQALDGMISQIAQVPGPKTFVWITQGIPSLQLATWRRVRDRVGQSSLPEFAAALTAVETAAYTVHQPDIYTDPLEYSGNVDSPIDTLRHLSNLTGGRIYGTDDLTPTAIREASTDACSMNYRVAFLPAHDDGKYRKIRVEASRPGVRVLAADRYDASASDAAALTDVIERAVALSPFHHSDIRFAAQASEVPESPGAFRFAIQIDPRDVMPVTDHGNREARISVALLAISKAGERRFLDPTRTRLPLNESRNTLDLTRQLHLDPATARVRIAVFDESSNLAGTLTVPLSQSENHPK